MARAVYYEIVYPDGSESIAPTLDEARRLIAERLDCELGSVVIGPVDADGDHEARLDGGEAVVARIGEVDRALADRIADVDDPEPLPGWEDRAVARARREGLLPQPDGSRKRRRTSTAGNE